MQVDGCSRPGVLRYPSGGRNSSQVTAATETGISTCPPSASGGDLLAGLGDGFDCGRARRGGGFHPFHGGIDCIVIAVIGSPAEKGCGFLYSGGRRHRGGSLEPDNCARYPWLLEAV
jgi:hypothetical protein